VTGTRGYTPANRMMRLTIRRRQARTACGQHVNSARGFA
jgi:hypothetical protein